MLELPRWVALGSLPSGLTVRTFPQYGRVLLSIKEAALNAQKPILLLRCPTGQGLYRRVYYCAAVPGRGKRDFWQRLVRRNGMYFVNRLNLAQLRLEDFTIGFLATRITLQIVRQNMFGTLCVLLDVSIWLFRYPLCFRSKDETLFNIAGFLKSRTPGDVPPRQTMPWMLVTRTGGPLPRTDPMDVPNRS